MASTRIDTTVTARGLRIALAPRCESLVADILCTSAAGSDPQCDASPVREEAVTCPPDLDFKNISVSLQTPWGGVYRARSSVKGVAVFPVDWSGTGVDPLAPDAAAQMATGWLVYTDDERTLPLKLEPAEVERMLAAIGDATDTQYEAGADGARTALAAEFRELAPVVPGQPAAVELAITNRGASPAYRVIAKLRSTIDPSPAQMSFGRIAPGATKVKTRTIAVPPRLGGGAGYVGAEVSSANADDVKAGARFSIVPGKAAALAQGLDLACKLAAAEIAPGERVRIACELRNQGSEAALDLRAMVAVGTTVSRNLAPQRLPGGASVKLDLVGRTSGSEPQGAKLSVKIIVGALGFPFAEQELTVRVATFAARCTARLTPEEYKAKRRRLQNARDAGALTAKEFQKYDAEYQRCLK